MRIAARVPVPPGFVIPVDVCRRFNSLSSSQLTQIDRAIENEIVHLAHLTGREFNGKRLPLLLSVRSGAAVSMPGMMETVLNIGLTEETMRGLIRQTGNPKFAWDCMRRFIQQYAEVIHDFSPHPFEKILEDHLSEDQIGGIQELDIDSLKKIVAEFTAIFRLKTGLSFPQSPAEQLKSAIKAVLRSWHSKRASAYRQIHSISDDLGTAVIVQAMVFGNMGCNSGSGVGFTRNPANGAAEPYIDYLFNSQGEDVVSGRRNAEPWDVLERQMPEVTGQLFQVCRWLEEEFRDMQDFEFTVEQGRLYFLQSRSGKRTARAALKIAVDMVEEGVIEPVRALEMLQSYYSDDFSTVSFILSAEDLPIAAAMSGGTGVVVGSAVFDVNRIDGYLGQGKQVIYLCRSLSTGDIEVMNRVQGLVTTLGARTSHPAVVARQLGKVCLVGCASLRIGPDLRHCILNGMEITEGDVLSLDGETGFIYRGRLERTVSRPTEMLEKVAAWKKALQAVA